MAKPNGITGVPYDDCRIFTFVPIFPIDDIALHSNSTSRRQDSKRSPERLRQVVMQGGLEDGRRDYASIFESLQKEIRGMYYEFPNLSFLLTTDYDNLADPKLWGYLIPNNNSAPFIPDPEVFDPFSLVSLIKL